jgi:hypothetical protein
MARPKTSILWKVNREELLKVYSKSETLSDVLRHYGLRAAGGNHKTLEKVLSTFNIDYETKKLDAKRKKQQTMVWKTRIPSEELFVENSKHSRSSVRRRILKDNLIPYICAICGMEPMWLGQPLTLILDHINCNSQLPTHCGKNIVR